MIKYKIKEESQSLSFATNVCQHRIVIQLRDESLFTGGLHFGWEIFRPLPDSLHIRGMVPLIPHARSARSVIAYFLLMFQISKPIHPDLALMNEYISASVLRSDETKSFFAIEPFATA